MPRRYDNSDRGVLISRESIGRLAKQGHRADDLRRNVHAPPLRTAFDDGEPLKLGKSLAVGEWAKGTLASVQVYDQGDPPNETTDDPVETIEDVVNKFADIDQDAWVMIGLASNGRWYVISAECNGGTSSTPSDP